MAPQVALDRREQISGRSVELPHGSAEILAEADKPLDGHRGAVVGPADSRSIGGCRPSIVRPPVRGRRDLAATASATTRFARVIASRWRRAAVRPGARLVRPSFARQASLPKLAIPSGSSTLRPAGLHRTRVRRSNAERGEPPRVGLPLAVRTLNMLSLMARGHRANWPLAFGLMDEAARQARPESARSGR
jgi:hypothetical protein